MYLLFHSKDGKVRSIGFILIRQSPPILVFSALILEAFTSSGFILEPLFETLFIRSNGSLLPCICAQLVVIMQSLSMCG